MPSAVAFSCKNGTQVNHLENVHEVVLTGGGSKLKSVAEVAGEVFKLPAKLGHARNVSGANRHIENPAFTTAIGVTKFAMECTSSTSVCLETLTKPLPRSEPKMEFHTNFEYLSALRKEADLGKNLYHGGDEDLDAPTFLRKGTDGVQIKHAKQINTL